MKVDDLVFWKIIGYTVFIVSLGAISAHKITEHGREIQKIKQKLEPFDNKNRLMTAVDVEYQLKVCGTSHKATTERIFDDIAEIKQTLHEGERRRDKAREERGHHLEQLTASINKLLEAKLK